MKKRASKIMFDIFNFIVGAFVYSVGVNMFLAPKGISPGGVTGVATVVNYLTGTPTGAMLFVLNIPILILGFLKMGGVFILKTSFVTIVLSVTLDVSARVLPSFETDDILSSLFGGMLIGLGLSLVMLRGATTGGIDIIAKFINRIFRHLSVGKIILMADGVIILLTALVYKNVESALYSSVAIYVATRVMDMLLYGADKGKIIYIITKQSNIICREINNSIGRGVTKLSVIGGYTGEQHAMLMCTVRVHEVAAVYDVIKEYDGRAFVVVSDAGEIIGEGFKMQS